MAYYKNDKPLEGTTFFDNQMAKKGYGLNKMCFSFNEKSARDEFLKDEMAYCDKYGLTEEQKEAIRNRDVLGLLNEGGSIYYLAKFVGILGMNMQDIGGIQTGMTTEEFKQKLVDAGK
ncbi:MAG: protocatechuate 4,5-dioxygenase subunit alpha [Vibrio sp.]